LFSDKLAGHSNFLYYDDLAFQTFLEKLRTEVDSFKKQTYKIGLARSVQDEPPALILYQPQLLSVYKDDIGGLNLTPEGYIDLRKAFIEFR